jgi:hypothetical protein
MESLHKFNFKVSVLPSSDLVFENALFCNDKDYESIKNATKSKALVYCYIKNSCMLIKAHSGVQQGHIAISKLLREAIGVSETIGNVEVECNLCHLI